MKESREVLFEEDSALGELKEFPGKKERLSSPPKRKSTSGLARRRVLSFFIDFLLLYGSSIGFVRLAVVGLLLFLEGGQSSSSQDFNYLFLQGFSVVFPSFLLFSSFLYYTIATFFWGKTVGQSLTSLEVFSRGPQGEKSHPSLYQCFLRYLGSLLSFCSLGFLFFLGAYRNKGRVFQDWLSLTEVGEHMYEAPEEVSVVELKLFRKEEEKEAA